MSDGGYAERRAEQFRETERIARLTSRGGGFSSGASWGGEADLIWKKLGEVIDFVNAHVKKPHSPINIENSVNKGLIDEVTELKGQLEEANKRITTLESTVQELKAQSKRDTKPETPPQPIEPEPEDTDFGFPSSNFGIPGIRRSTFGGRNSVADNSPQEDERFIKAEILDSSDTPAKDVISPAKKAEVLITVSNSLTPELLKGDFKLSQHGQVDARSLYAPELSYTPSGTPFVRNNFAGFSPIYGDYLESSGGGLIHGEVTASILSDEYGKILRIKGSPQLAGNLLGIGWELKNGDHEFNFVMPSLSGNGAFGDLDIPEQEEIKGFFLPGKAWPVGELESDYLNDLIAKAVVRDKNFTAIAKGWRDFLDTHKGFLTRQTQFTIENGLR